VRLTDLVTTSLAVAGTASRGAKRDLIAGLLARAGDDVGLAVDHLTATPRQRRTGVGWRSLATLPAAATEPSLSIRDVDAAFDEMAAVAGAGSGVRRREIVERLFGRATAEEQEFLRAVLFGELRQGALAGVMLDAIAVAANVPVAAVRRAAMLNGSPSRTAEIALADGTEGLAAVGLITGVAVSPMLAASAPDVATAMETVRGDSATTAVVVDAKVDGVRVQIHRDRDAVRIFTRSLDDITSRMPEVVRTVLGIGAETIILDGEAIMLGPDGRPRPFQETGSRAARGEATGGGLTLFAFDLLHLDGVDLIDEPAEVRFAELERVAGSLTVPRVVTADVDEARRAFDDAVGAGFEGVVVKSADAPYAAGRRGAGWVKVKPVHTLDLVVIGVEWGSGRRRGRLSNIHLGARDPETGGFVMVGKTFKGMTDAMLEWQTGRFLELEAGREGHVVWVRPEQVVEIALDGVQRSRRYPGGVALRFARVVRYRDDKTADEADTIDSVRAMLGG